MNATRHSVSLRESDATPWSVARIWSRGLSIGDQVKSGPGAKRSHCRVRQRGGIVLPTLCAQDRTKLLAPSLSANSAGLELGRNRSLTRDGRRTDTDRVGGSP